MRRFNPRAALFALALVSVGQSLMAMELRWAGWTMMAAGAGAVVAAIAGPRRPGPRT